MGAYYKFLGAYYQFLGACFYKGNIIIFTLIVWGKVLLGVIINNWGHIITFWGQGFIGGDYFFWGARLLATYKSA